MPQKTHLDVLIVDLCGNAIGKRLPASALPSVFAGGTPVCAAMQPVDAMDNTADPMGQGFSDGDRDVYARPLCYEPRQMLERVLGRFAESPGIPAQYSG